MNTDFLITKIHRITYVGKSEYPEKITRFKNGWCHNELILGFSGSSTVNFNGLTLECDKNSLRFLPAGRVDEYTVNRHVHGDCIFFQFDTDRPISDVAFVTKTHNNRKIAELFKTAFSLWITKNEGYYFECISLLYKIFAEMQKTVYLPDRHYALIKPAVDLINEQFLTVELNGEKLASLCGISYSYLKKLFVKRFSVPPKRYMIQLRINYAEDLLAAGEQSITEIAEMSGFRDVYFFSRQFKAYVGITPTEFRQKYKSSK